MSNRSSLGALALLGIPALMGCQPENQQDDPPASEAAPPASEEAPMPPSQTGSSAPRDPQPRPATVDPRNTAQVDEALGQRPSPRFMAPARPSVLDDGETMIGKDSLDIELENGRYATTFMCSGDGGMKVSVESGSIHESAMVEDCTASSGSAVQTIVQADFPSPTEPIIITVTPTDGSRLAWGYRFDLA